MDSEIPKTEPPNGVFDWFHREWPQVKNAPWSFGICVLILSSALCAGAFWLSEKFHESEIRGKDATIQKLLLRPESIPEQQKELSDLRIEVATLLKDREEWKPREWPPLSEEQIALWVKSLSGQGLRSIAVFWGPGVNADRFYMSLQKVANRMKIDVHAGEGSTSRNLIVVCAFKEQAAAAKIVALLKDAGYNAVLSPYEGEGIPEKIGNVDFYMGEKFGP